MGKMVDMVVLMLKIMMKLRGCTEEELCVMGVIMKCRRNKKGKGFWRLCLPVGERGERNIYKKIFVFEKKKGFEYCVGV